MKKLLMLIPLLLLSGCLYQIADMTDLKKAEQFCSDKGGVKYIRINFVSDEVVYCINGKYQFLDKYYLKGYQNETE